MLIKFFFIRGESLNFDLQFFTDCFLRLQILIEFLNLSVQCFHTASQFINLLNAHFKSSAHFGDFIINMDNSGLSFQFLISLCQMFKSFILVKGFFVAHAILVLPSHLCVFS